MGFRPLIFFNFFKNRKLIKNSFDDKIQSYLEFCFLVDSTSKFPGIVTKLFHIMLQKSQTEPGKILLKYARNRLKLKRGSSIKSMCLKVEDDLKSKNQHTRFNAQFVCSIFLKSSNIIPYLSE